MYFIRFSHSFLYIRYTPFFFSFLVHNLYRLFFLFLFLFISYFHLPSWHLILTPFIGSWHVPPQPFAFALLLLHTPLPSTPPNPSPHASSLRHSRAESIIISGDTCVNGTLRLFWSLGLIYFLSPTLSPSVSGVGGATVASGQDVFDGHLLLKLVLVVEHCIT